ncbi:MAG TPA: DNA-3-methyladenine glycosylase 2 family protein [Devosia sp.]|nr:DNA-3-methyladenine glycosylase 2 family protein [Devosia sp.]
MDSENRASFERLTSGDVLKRHLAALVILDPALKPVLAEVGEVPLRLGRSGFAGLASIVSSQLLSVASARAIHSRVEKLAGEMNAENFLALEFNDLRKAGLSRSKITCMQALAEAELEGMLDYEHIHRLPVGEAMAALTSLKGIGPWSAEIYLMSAAGHPDIFPAGDLVLQKMVGKVLNKRQKPDEKATRKIARRWSPHGGSAARLLWRYFAVLRNREGINL